MYFWYLILIYIYLHVFVGVFLTRDPDVCIYLHVFVDVFLTPNNDFHEILRLSQPVIVSPKKCQLKKKYSHQIFSNYLNNWMMYASCQLTNLLSLFSIDRGMLLDSTYIVFRNPTNPIVKTVCKFIIFYLFFMQKYLFAKIFFSFPSYFYAGGSNWLFLFINLHNLCMKDQTLLGHS